MGRSPCCSKVGLRRGPWSTKEDTLLTNFIQENGEGLWRSLPMKAGLLRCGKSCRLRWMNYLRPGILRGNITQDEEDLIIRLHGLLGNRWSVIAGRLPGRTDNEIKNYWNTHLLKKLNSRSDLAAAIAKTKKINKKMMKTAADVVAKDIEEKEKEMKRSSSKTQVLYHPKAIRVSSRTNSCDSSFLSTDAVPPEVVPYFPVMSMFEENDQESVPVLNHDVDMWEKVYHEYLQLLH